MAPRSISSYICSVLLLITLMAPGCAGKDLQVGLGEEAVLAPGQRLIIAGEDLQIRFIRVSQDSRCPKGVYCIWAGEVTCVTEVTHGSTSREVTLTEPGLREEGYCNTSFDGYELAFHVTPYPDARQGKIAPQEYRLHLVVTRPTAFTSIIGPILSRPTEFKGQEVTIVGYYRGWDLLQEANRPPPLTRSDWVVKDSSGAIYVSAASKAKAPEGLQPGSLESTSVRLEVRGTVEVTPSGEPYIEATSVRRLP